MSTNGGQFPRVRDCNSCPVLSDRAHGRGVGRQRDDAIVVLGQNGGEDTGPNFERSCGSRGREQGPERGSALSASDSRRFTFEK